MVEEVGVVTHAPHHDLPPRHLLLAAAAADVGGPWVNPHGADRGSTDLWVRQCWPVFVPPAEGTSEEMGQADNNNSSSQQSDGRHLPLRSQMRWTGTTCHPLYLFVVCDAHSVCRLGNRNLTLAATSPQRSQQQNRRLTTSLRSRHRLARLVTPLAV